MLSLTHYGARSALATLFALSGTATASAIEETFEVSSGGKLVVEAQSAKLDVQGSDTDQLQVMISRGSDDASEIEDDYTIEFSRQGGEVKLVVERRNNFSGWWTRSRSLHIEVSLPDEFDVDLQTSGGSIDLDGTSGNADLKTSGGTIRIGHVGGEIRARTSGGNISIDRAGSTVSAHTSGGRIEIDELHGAIDAQTSGGSIRVGIAGQPTADSTLKTSGGSVTVFVEPTIAVALDARTSGGRASSELPITVLGSASKDRLEGDINGGGPLLKLRSSGGSVSLRTL